MFIPNFTIIKQEQQNIVIIDDDDNKSINSIKSDKSINSIKSDKSINSIKLDEDTDTSVVVNKSVKIYDQKQYNKTFIEKNELKIKEKHTCDICCGSYTYYNKSKHLKSVKHIKMVEKLKSLEKPKSKSKK